jgi:hypothetical protein
MDDDSYYTFNVKYADDTVKLSVEMANFLHSGSAINRPGSEIPVYMSDLGSESPYLVRLIIETIHRNNKKKIKHIENRNFGIQSLPEHRRTAAVSTVAVLACGHNLETV